MTTDTATNIVATVKPILKERGIARADLIGSTARGEETGNSDIDIVVELPENSTLFELADLKYALEQKLRRPVDVLTYRSVSPKIKDSVFSSTVSIL